MKKFDKLMFIVSLFMGCGALICVAVGLALERVTVTYLIPVFGVACLWLFLSLVISMEWSREIRRRRRWREG